MPTVKPTTKATATQTTEVKLKPLTRKKLLHELRAYQAVQEQIKALDHAKKGHLERISGLHEEAGADTIELEGFRTLVVRGVSSKLDTKKLLEQGVTLAQIEAATVTKPKRPYVKVTAPGDKEDGREE